MQSQDKPVSEAFLDVVVKSTRFDSFSQSSGMRVGRFELSFAMPWEAPEDTAHDPAIRRQPRRDVPPGLSESADKEEIVSTEFQAVWACPGPELGTVVVTLNLRLRNSGQWQQLSYSLKESPIRVNQAVVPGSEDVAKSLGKDGAKFAFDQEDRHRKFWAFVRDKQWEAVASFLEKRCVLYCGDEVHRKRFRAMNMLAEMFDSCEWLVLHTPFVFAAGHTKSVVLCETEFDDDQDALEEDEEEEWSDVDEDGEDEEGQEENGQEGQEDPGDSPEDGVEVISADREVDTSASPVDSDSQLPRPSQMALLADDDVSELSAEFPESDKQQPQQSEGAAEEGRAATPSKERKLSVAKARQKAQDLQLPKVSDSLRVPFILLSANVQVIFTRETSGRQFDKLVRSLRWINVT